MLNPSDPRYRAEFVPRSISAMGPRLCAAFGVGADAFGTKGNLAHESGYHRSRNWVLYSPDSAYGARDYSVQLEADRGGDPDAVSAFDFTPGTWGTADNRAKMIKITKRLLVAAQRNDPRLADLREVAGTIDGRNVITFYAQGGALKTPFDPTHLEHVHGSFWRNRNANDHSGIVEVMLTDDMGDEDDMGASWPPIDILADEPTSVTLVETEGGGADPRAQWFRVCNDTGGRAGQTVAPPYALRVMGGDGKGGWSPVFPAAVVKFESGKLASVQLKAGVTVVSVQRAAINAGGTPLDPSQVAPEDLPADATFYSGHLTFVVERGPVVH